MGEQGRRYCIAYASVNTAGIQAAIASGLAIGVLGRSMMPGGTRILTAEDGFKGLAGANVILRVRPGAASAVAESMVAAIRTVVRAGRI